MPSWNHLLDEIKTAGTTYDIVRRRYLKKLYKLTGRNIILYYSGWLQKPDLPPYFTMITDSDKTGFMTVIHQMDRSKGLDLVLHTPGGDAAATESLVVYLRSLFKSNIRVLVPELALSAGTLIACAAKQIVMGKQSSLGPIDPQFGRIPAHGVVEEFKRAYQEIKNDPAKIPVWQPIIAKYNPTFIGECEKAIALSRELAGEWLKTGMLEGREDAEEEATRIAKELSDHAGTKSHSRHLPIERCADLGLTVVRLEDDPRLQDAVLTVHHACIHTLSGTNAFKIIENHRGKAFVQTAQKVVVSGK